MKIKYTFGDATNPQSDKKKIIIHICNNIGGWGKGFVMAISKKWKEPEHQYREWHISKENFELGEVQFIQVEDSIFVANMIGQEGIYTKGGTPPIRYESLRTCLSKVAEFALNQELSIHAPRIGAGLAGGDWVIIEQIIEEELIAKNIEVTIYDLITI